MVAGSNLSCPWLFARAARTAAEDEVIKALWLQSMCGLVMQGPAGMVTMAW